MSDEKMLAIINRIKTRRLELGLSYQDLAEKTGMSKSTLQRYETGAIKNIPLDKLEVLADALKMDPVRLIGLTPLYEPPTAPDRSSDDYTDQADSLFIDKYGMQTYDVAMKYDRLDDKDKIRAEERIDTLLEDDKYKRDSFEAMAI